MSVDKRNRNWVFTLNNPVCRLSEFVAYLQTDERIKYSKVALEVGETGTQHFQGYVVFKQPQRFAALQKLIPGAHFEQRQGSHEQARDYVGKSDKSGEVKAVQEFGKEPRSGGRGTSKFAKEVEMIKQQIDIGDVSIDDLWNEHFNVMLRYGRGIETYFMRTNHARLKGENQEEKDC